MEVLQNTRFKTKVCENTTCPNCIQYSYNQGGNNHDYGCINCLQLAQLFIDGPFDFDKFNDLQKEFIIYMYYDLHFNYILYINDVLLVFKDEIQFIDDNQKIAYFVYVYNN